MKFYLVGGAITILKNMSSSMGRMTSHIYEMENNPVMFETTNQLYMIFYDFNPTQTKPWWFVLDFYVYFRGDLFFSGRILDIGAKQ